MKTDELLYDLMGELSDSEAYMIEKDLEKISSHNSIDEVSMKRQETMAITKIFQQIEAEKNSKKVAKHRVPLRKKRVAILVAVVVMIFGIVACGRKNDWDIEFAQMLGVDHAMEEMKGGYVRIDKSQKKGDIVVTVQQAIGDQHNQWVQIDTNVPWEVGEDGYYMFDEYMVQCVHSFNKVYSQGSSFVSYNNNGMVSFLLNMSENGRINRADVELKLGRLYAYENKEGEGTLISDEIWEIKWSNYYSVNTLNKYPFVKCDDVIIRKVEISPISVKVDALATRNYDVELRVEKVNLKDGTSIKCEYEGGSNSNGIFISSEALIESMEGMKLEEIKSITINGIEIEMQ